MRDYYNQDFGISGTYTPRIVSRASGSGYVLYHAEEYTKPAPLICAYCGSEGVVAGSACKKCGANKVTEKHIPRDPREVPRTPIRKIEIDVPSTLPEVHKFIASYIPEASKEVVKQEAKSALKRIVDRILK